MSKTDHLAKAKDYLAKGDDYYFKAAEEIMAAKAERPELTWTEIGRRLDRSERWVRRLVAARADFLKTGEFGVDHESGSNKRDEVTAKTLAKADDRQVAEIINDLPTEAVEESLKRNQGEQMRTARVLSGTKLEQFARYAASGITGTLQAYLEHHSALLDISPEADWIIGAIDDAEPRLFVTRAERQAA